MPLPNGVYFIRSVAQKNGERVGRDIIEDRSLLPKRVVAAPADRTPIPVSLRR